MIIGIFLVGGVLQMYLSSRVSQQFTESNSELQDNSRFVFDIMSSDIRITRFLGCLPYEGDNSNVVNHLNTAAANYDSAIHDFIDEPPIAFTEDDGLNGSDSITIHTAYPTLSTIKEPHNVNREANIEISINNTIKDNDIILISNCSGGDIFEVSGISAGANAAQSALSHTLGAGTPGNRNGTLCAAAPPAHCLSQEYGANSAIFVLQAIRYDIRNGANGEPSLWRTVNDEAEELVNGVEEMQILVGIDTNDDGGPNQYVTPTDVVDDTQIVSIRILLLLKSSMLNVLTSAQEYTFNNAVITSADLNLRRSFLLTVALKNR